MKNSISEIDSLLLKVQKPGRYVGGELNSITRADPVVRMAVSYPDLYEVGMSNNGIRIIYDAVNRIRDAACERVFAVAGDFEEVLRHNNIPLYTLETRTPLNECDIVGFNISHELLYTNMLQVLDLGRIPLCSADRGEDSPVILAGGEAVSNPFPIADFVDAFFLGDGEEGITDIIRVMMDARSSGSGRREILEKIGEIQGVLIPSGYSFSYNGFSVSGIEGKAVNRRVYRGSVPSDPEKPVLPNLRIAQDRAVVEVARGCGNLCKFCHAGYYDLPCRNYAADSVIERIESIISNTGYNEVTLSSLSVSDYPFLQELLERVLPGLTERGISISLPSLRVDRSTLPVIEQISDVRKSSLTFAVESACTRLREISNKKVFIDELLEIVEHVFRRGWRVIKLYFMIGLPGCREHDEAEEIIKLMKRVLDLGRGKKEINITVSPFVPKPHTPFQWAEQMDMAYLDETVLRIKRGLPRTVRVKNHDIRSSTLEGVFSRGDQRLGEVILRAYKEGCRFDSWNEHFRFDIWKQCLDSILPGWEMYLSERGRDCLFPWSVVETGYEDMTAKRADHVIDLGSTEKEGKEKIPPDLSALEGARERFMEKYNTALRMRFIFTKKGRVRFTSHLDYMEVVLRGLRMSGIPLSFTQGFNKREKISAGFPLPLGIESESEIIDAELYAPVPGDALAAVSGNLPEGVDLVCAREIEGKESLMAVSSAAGFRILCPEKETGERIWSGLQGGVSFQKKTKKGIREVLFEDVVLEYSRDDEGLFLLLSTGTESSVRIDSVISCLCGMDYAEIEGISVFKTGQYSGERNNLILIQ